MPLVLLVMCCRSSEINFDLILEPELHLTPVTLVVDS